MRLLTACALAACQRDPSLTILTPEDGDQVCGAPLQVEVSVGGIELVAPVTDPADAEAGTGHIDVTLNGQEVAMVWETLFEVPDVAPGEYQLKAELSNADHTPVEPYAGAFLYITVTEPTCSP